MDKINRYKTFTLCIFLIVTIIGCDNFWKWYDSQLIKDYNIKLKDVTKTQEEHNIFIKNVNSAFEDFTKDRNIDNLAKIIGWEETFLKYAKSWIDILSDFKSFVEINEKKLRRTGINPDYIRDDTIRTIKLIQDNEVMFRQNIAQQYAVSPFLPRSKKKKKN